MPKNKPSRKQRKAQAEQEYKKWHWGVNPIIQQKLVPPSTQLSKKWKKKWDDMYLDETGRFVEFHYSPLNGSAKRKDKVVKLSKKDANESHLVFDVEHPNQRLYIYLNKGARDQMKKTLKSDYDYMPLSELALETGGLHSTDDYPDIMVRPIGLLTNVVYATEKGAFGGIGLEDGYSMYIHTHGEESGIQPILAMASDGSLWYAGGDYTCPTAGITN